MKWLSIARKDGKPDPYAVGLCTHTVSTVSVAGHPIFEAWRLKAPVIRLGTFKTFAEAQNTCLCDAQKPVTGELS